MAARPLLRLEIRKPQQCRIACDIGADEGFGFFDRLGHRFKAKPAQPLHRGGFAQAIHQNAIEPREDFCRHAARRLNAIPGIEFKTG